MIDRHHSVLTWARRTFWAMIVLLAGDLAGCGTADGRDAAELTPAAAAQVPLWANGSFEADAVNATPPSGWSVTTATNPGFTGSNLAPPLGLANLNLSAPGSGLVETFTVGGAALSQVDPDLGAGQPFRFPRFGRRAARVNYLSAAQRGQNKNVNVLQQTMTLDLGDIDPADGRYHVRFVLAPVLENPSHPFTQQPYYFVTLTNLSRKTTLYRAFNTAGQDGVPWNTTQSLVTGTTTQWVD